MLVLFSYESIFGPLTSNTCRNWVSVLSALTGDGWTPQSQLEMSAQNGCLPYWLLPLQTHTALCLPLPYSHPPFCHSSQCFFHQLSWILFSGLYPRALTHLSTRYLTGRIWSGFFAHLSISVQIQAQRPCSECTCWAGFVQFNKPQSATPWSPINKATGGTLLTHLRK